MPALAMVSGGHTALFAHQELAFIDALSRWPVRVMFADEVGLGKTFEAGAVRELSTPPHRGVARRWSSPPRQSSISGKRSSTSTSASMHGCTNPQAAFLSSEGEVRVLSPSEPVLGKSPRLSSCRPSSPEVLAASGHLFAEVVDMPDVLVVDEAHAARVRPDETGSERPTLMWRLLDDIMPKVPHVIFATATPMQVHWREYHALLELLGLPEVWRKPDNYVAV